MKKQIQKLNLKQRCKKRIANHQIELIELQKNAFQIDVNDYRNTIDETLRCLISSYDIAMNYNDDCTSITHSYFHICKYIYENDLYFIKLNNEIEN